MKKLLILIVSAAIFLHFYPQPELTAWYEQQKAQVLTFFSDATDTKVRLKASKIYEELSAGKHSFSSNELNTIRQISQSRRQLKDFQQAYCEGNKSHPVFHQVNLKKVCTKIGEYQGLL